MYSIVFMLNRYYLSEVPVAPFFEPAGFYCTDCSAFDSQLTFSFPLN